MGFWGVFWLWSLLTIAALVVFGFIAKSLYNRALSASHQAMRLSRQLEKLTAELERKQKLSPVEDSLLADPGKLQMRRKALVKAKIKKQEQRQRRLMASLKRFDPNESRFH
jgi:uncharacterized membrane-anchored protein YhcB (DUF1043 family)